MSKESLNQSTETGLNHCHSTTSDKKPGQGCWLGYIPHAGVLTVGEMMEVEEVEEFVALAIIRLIWIFLMMTTMIQLSTTRNQEDGLLSLGLCADW